MNQMEYFQKTKNIERPEGPQLTRILLNYHSPTVKHDKILIYDFCVLWTLRSIYLQDAKVANENFIMCNGGWISLFPLANALKKITKSRNLFKNVRI